MLPTKRKRIGENVYWSSLPGLPKKVKWPVIVEDWCDVDGGKPLVYCRSDNAYFKVSRDQLVSFPGPFDQLKGQGAAILMRKKQLSTLSAFHHDIEWAQVESSEMNICNTDEDLLGLSGSSDVNNCNSDKVLPGSLVLSNENIYNSDQTELESSTSNDKNNGNSEEVLLDSPESSDKNRCNSGDIRLGSSGSSAENICNSVILSNENKCCPDQTELDSSTSNDNRGNSEEIMLVSQESSDKNRGTFNSEEVMLGLLELSDKNRGNSEEIMPESTEYSDKNRGNSEKVLDSPHFSDINRCYSGQILLGSLVSSNENKSNSDQIELDSSMSNDKNRGNSEEIMLVSQESSDKNRVTFNSEEVMLGLLESSDKNRGNSEKTPLGSPQLSDINRCNSDKILPGPLQSSNENKCNSDQTEQDLSIWSDNKRDISEEIVLDSSELSNESRGKSEEIVIGSSESSDDLESGAYDSDSDDNYPAADEKFSNTSEESDSDMKNKNKKFNAKKKHRKIREENRKLMLGTTDSESSDECEYDSDGKHLDAKENFSSNSESNDEFESDSEDETRNLESKSKQISSKLKLRDVNNCHIYVRKLMTSKHNRLTGIRKKSDFVWNHVHCCKFCGKVCTNIAKHYTSKEKDKKEVIEIVELSKRKGAKNKIVRAKWDMLRQEGDHIHNIKVLGAGKGEFIVSRRQHDRLDISRYGPCPSCLKWLRLEKTMFKHKNTCPVVILGDDSNINISAQEMRIRSLGIAGKLSPLASPALKKEVFIIMTNDNVSSVAQADPMIIALGNLWMSKNIGNRLKRKYYTSSRMRGAARLLINARQVLGDDISMHELLVTEHFNDLVRATIMTASPEMDDTEDLKSPSTAIKLGYDIKRMLGAKWAQALKEKCPEDKQEAKDVFKLMEIEWSVKVTKLASTILQVRKFNMERSLPEPTDLVELNNHIKKQIHLLDLTDSSPPSFRRACELTESRLLLYNKRRSGEVEGIRIVEYVKRQTGISNIDRTMRSELSALEKKLLESQELLETRGKFGRGVPVIIPPDLRNVLQYLATASVRTSAARLSSNRYLFANSRNGVIRAYDSLKTLCSEIDLLKPEKITSVNLRKYMATISQVFDLNDQQQSWLVNHMGHSMDIHKIHYRQTSSAIERIDISKLMLIEEFNLSSKYAGQNLESIQLKELLFGNDSDEITMKDQEELPDASYNEELPVASDNEDEEYQPRLNDVAEEVFDEFDFTEEVDVQSKRKKSAAAGNRKRWSEVEMAEIKILFKENLETLTTPGMKACLKAIQKSKKENGELCKRSWETIKKKVWNEIQKKK